MACPFNNHGQCRSIYIYIYIEREREREFFSSLIYFSLFFLKMLVYVIT